MRSFGLPLLLPVLVAMGQTPRPADAPERVAVQDVDRVLAQGEVDQVYGPTLFTMRDVPLVPPPHVVIVFDPKATQPRSRGESVLVSGTLGRFDANLLAKAYAWRPPPQLPATFQGMPRIIASSVEAAKPDIPKPSQPVLAPLADPYPVKMRLMILARTLTDVAGQYLLVPELAVERILSPRAFTVTGLSETGVPSALGRERALVITAAPVTGLKEGAEVEVLGRAYTLVGARAEPDWPSGLPEAVSQFNEAPVIIADTVRTPGGAPLFRRR